MPPAYINVGAYVDSKALIDSHALVGSCAQIGKRVHVSAAAQIGGVLEPIGALPVIIEDDVFIGGNTGIFEGTIVKQRAVIAAGVILTGSTPVYDLVNEKIYRRTKKIPSSFLNMQSSFPAAVPSIHLLQKIITSHSTRRSLLSIATPNQTRRRY